MFTKFTMIKEILSLITDCFCARRAIFLVGFCFSIRAVEIPNVVGGLNCVWFSG
jgi:hypothetical protein